MVQKIDTRYQEKATSRPLNQRYLDITGPCILRGYRTIKGTGDFSLSLSRGGFNVSVATSPSGARIEESTDLSDILTVQPNLAATGNRVDSVYLKYEFGKTDNVATYIIVPGTHIPAPNPNKNTHLLLALVYVQPNSTPIKPTDIIPMPYGFSTLEVAGSSIFHGPVTIDKNLVVKGDLIVEGQSGGGGTTSPTFIERLPAPIIATEGQTDFSLPTSYVMNTKTLFVYKNGELLPPSMWMEVTPTSFRLFTGAKKGDQIWAFWYRGLNVYTTPEHNHDDLYYRKYEIANRLPRYATDYFSGQVGRRVQHGLNMFPDNYVVIGVVPVEKTADVGAISVEKRENEIIVYNTGTYRGKFNLTYAMKAPFPEETNTYQATDWTRESSNWVDSANMYKDVLYRRRDGSVAMKSSMFMPDTSGRFTRTRVDVYNGDGSKVISSAVWAIAVGENGIISLITRVE